MDDRFVTCNVAYGQQREQHRQAQEDKLQRTRSFQRAEEHEQCEHAPQTRYTPGNWPLVASAGPFSA